MPSTDDILTRDSFEPLLNARFVLQLDKGPVELELIEVASLGAARPPLREPFSLMFRGPQAIALTQGTYALAHEALGLQHIFLVPIGRDQSSLQYQAIFA